MGVPFYCSAKSSANYYIKNLITTSTQLKCNKKHTHRELYGQYSNAKTDSRTRKFAGYFGRTRKFAGSL